MVNKKVSWTLDEKIKVIKEYKRSGLSKAAFSKMKSIPRTTFITILAAKGKIEKSLEVQDGKKRKKIRMSKFEDVEDALVKWFTSARSNNIPISGLLLKEKALEIAQEFGIQDFSASSGWIERFKERHGLSFKKICGEGTSANLDIVDDWRNSSLKELLARYNASDIYNLDETGLFFRVLPEKTLCFKSEKCIGVKKSKERLTVLLGSNMTGTDKLKPLVIGKSLKPRCLKNVKSLPVHYKANSKAWMSSEIWQHILKSYDKIFSSQKRKVAFIVDNCTAHTEVKSLKSIEVFYMPPNVTSILQPLDQGIILNFKRNYKKLLVQDWIKAIHENKTFRPSILDAIGYIHKSWNDLSTTAIKNCFRHAGFVSESTESEENTDDEDDVALSVLFQELLDKKVCTVDDCASYLDIDKYLPTSSEATITDIVEEVRESRNKTIEISDESESDGKNAENSKLPTKTEALEAINVIRRYILSAEEASDKEHDYLYKIEKMIMKCKSREHQTTMDEYFSSK